MGGFTMSFEHLLNRFHREWQVRFNFVPSEDAAIYAVKQPM
jgi:hypothetical protein